MAAEATRSSPSPDSYIGSLISLTSKSEIRYEGILYNINTEESSIGLRNVRSFGTEGRKDGQQLPASDKIYEFILFRGSDIKDLQVKASPPSQTAPLQTDPAIIQSHYSHPSTASPSLPENYAPLGNVSAPVLGPNTTHLGFQNSSFQGSLPTYPTGGSYGPWSATPSPPMANVSGLAAPIYWQGYYANPGGVPQMRQSSLNRPPPGLAMPPIQQGLPFQNANAPLLSGFSNYPEFPPMLQGENASLSSGSSNYPEFSSLFQPVSNNLGLTSTSMSSAVAPNQVTSLVPEGPPFSVSNKVPTTSLPMLVSSVNLPPVSSVAQGMEKSASLPQNMQSAGVSSKPRTVPSSVLDQVQSRSNVLLGSSSSSKQTEAPINLVTPDQLIQPSLSTGPSSQSQVKIPNEADVKPPKDRTKPLLSEPPASAPEDKAKSKSAPVSKGPILPLPAPAYHKTSGDSLHTTQSTRGRGRGRGNEHLQTAAKFPGEFDFAAMNEKFNKDEVWGNLSKNKAHSNYTEEEDEAYDFYEESADSKHVDAKPVYVKDDFFDTLSSNSNQQTSNGRIKFSEQLKIDTETFGNFVRNRSTYGGRGPRGGGGGRARGRSSHPGRGYGYAASGRYH